MLDLRLNGKSFELPDDINISVEITSSIFSDDEDGTLSLPFNIPITDNNSILLGSPEELKNRNAGKIVYDGFEILFNGILWKRGVLRLRSITGGNYVTNFNSDYSYFANKAKDKKISQLDLGGDRPLRSAVPFLRLKLVVGPGGFGTEVLTVQVSAHPDPIPDHAIAYQQPFNGDIPSTIVAIAIAWNAFPSALALANLSHVEADGEYLVVYSADNFSFPQYITNVAGPDRTWVTVDAFNQSEVTGLMKTMAEGSIDDYDFTFFTVKNPLLYNGDNPDYVGYVNYFTGGEFAQNLSEDFTGDNTICPFPYMLYIFRRAFEEHGIVPKGSFMTDSEIKQLCIYNNFVLDKFIYNSLGGYYGNQWLSDVNLKNHLPDMIVIDFIKAIKSAFFLCYFFNYEKAEVKVMTRNEILDNHDYDDWTNKIVPNPEQEFNESDGYIISPTKGNDGTDRVNDLTGFIIKDPVTNLADLPAEDNEATDLRLVTNLNVYYKPSLQNDSGITTWVWNEYSENIGDYVIGNGKEKIDLAFSTLPTKRIEEATDYDKNWWVPFVNQEGSSFETQQGIHQVKLMLCFYRGIQNDGDGNPYPMGTPYDKDYNFDTIGDSSLATDQHFIKYGKQWIDFLSKTQSVTLPTVLDFDDLLTIDFSKKKMIDNVKYILSKVKLTLRNNSVGDSTCEFMKL